MAFRVFDRVKVKAGAKVFSTHHPHGFIVTRPYEVQVHRVLTADQSPDGYGAVVAWRTPGNTDLEEQDWTQASSVTLLQSAAYP